jgi:hypothetical protein
MGFFNCDGWLIVSSKQTGNKPGPNNNYSTQTKESINDIGLGTLQMSYAYAQAWRDQLGGTSILRIQYLIFILTYML